jgi:uncharacterized protein (DUF2252 family)
MLDAAYWVKGCSSLGLKRYAVLLRVGASDDPESKFCLLDVKQAMKPAAPRHKNCVMPWDNARRVVDGAIALAPNLGERMRSAVFMGTQVFVRELLPQDLKVEIETLKPTEAMEVASYLGNVVGSAHARQMDDDQRVVWMGTLQQHWSQTIDAPSWLWQSIVELVKEHEGAYLEHCRKFANVPA